MRAISSSLWSSTPYVRLFPSRFSAAVVDSSVDLFPLSPSVALSDYGHYSVYCGRWPAPVHRICPAHFSTTAGGPIKCPFNRSYYFCSFRLWLCSVTALHISCLIGARFVAACVLKPLVAVCADAQRNGEELGHRWRQIAYYTGTVVGSYWSGTVPQRRYSVYCRVTLAYRDRQALAIAVCTSRKIRTAKSRVIRWFC